MQISARGIVSLSHSNSNWELLLIWMIINLISTIIYATLCVLPMEYRRQNNIDNEQQNIT